jgi:RHS repeat-associated protein
VSTVFSQPAFDATKVHALATVQSTSDLFPPAAQSITYTSFEKASKIKLGMDSICYTYGYDHQRISMEEHIGSSLRTKQYVGGCEYITETGTSGTKKLTYLTGPYGVFAVIEKQNGVQTPHYVLKDNLGSWTTITNGSGTVEQRLSYDAWGNQRNPNTWANYTAGDCFDKPVFDRGFTGHEHLTAFCLINMNGRMYDPVMSSFLSADRYVQDPTSAQGFNRYAYCMYNPLRFVDPTGWQMIKPAPGRTPSSDLFYRDPYAYADGRGWEPRDFRGAGYMYNMAFYGNVGGSGGGFGGGGGSCNYYGSYGYYVSYYANSANNYCFPSTQLQLIHEWQNNPCYTTNKEMCEAGISNLSVGELYGSYLGNPGYRNSYYTWTDSNGRLITTSLLYEYVGGNSNGAYIISNLPLEMYYRRYNQTINKIGFAPYEVGDCYATTQKACYTMNYNVIVDRINSSIYVNANSYNTLVVNGTVKPYAKAFLYNNNQIIDSKPLQYSGESIINRDDYCFVGCANFTMPSSGNVVLKIEGGWGINFYQCGYYMPTFMGIGINSNTTFVLRNYD